MKITPGNPKGQVLVLLAVIITVLLGLAALALDIGRAYGVRAKLNAAVDAASYEATRVLGQGSDKNNETLMKEKAQAVATAYFNANYPAGYLGATPATGTPSFSAVRGEDGNWSVSISATATMPTFFAGVLGSKWQSLDISSSAGAERKTVDMVLVIDTSYSLNAVFSPVAGTSNASVKESAKAYVDWFNANDDRVGLVAFSSATKTIVPISKNARGFDKDKIKAEIDKLSSAGNTASEEGMREALAQLENVDADKRSGKRVIVFFSDGAPNTINGDFPLGSGKKKGNLYAAVGSPPGTRPSEIFSQTSYPSTKADSTGYVNSLPAKLTDVDGSISMKGTRVLSGKTTDAEFQCDVIKAARNMVENVATAAHDKGVFVYTLGLGAQLENPYEVPSTCDVLGNGKFEQEKGSTILANLAAITSGIYCKAETVDDLTPCFDKLASSILRISK